ncbi:BCCT family transporter [Candidatus Palauibacter sp.]
MAAVPLLADGLQALQTAAIAAALPVNVVLLFMAAGLLKSLARHP